jgi:precorrin-6A/cobalt-precorrin-6A reductase
MARDEAISTTRLLILGGTGEAAALARAVLARFGEAIAVTTALAGRTRNPGPIPGMVRIGGFGGPPGLADYLLNQRVDRVIDATHPFAAEISSAARLACDQLDVPRLLLLRPAWRRHPLDRWIEVDSIEAAAQIVGRVGRRALLTVGASEVAAFAPATGVRFVVRLVDPPREPLPLRFHEIVFGRGPFALTEERHLLQRHAIDVLVCKASGGAATEAKLVGARELSLPVIMVRRPPVERGLSVDNVEAALDWLAGLDERPEARRMS